LLRRINNELVTQASGVVDECRRQVAEESGRNQEVARLVGMSLAVLGMCGAVAGLLAGYGVARSVARSIDQLGGSVQSIAKALDDGARRDDDSAMGLRELITAMNRISDRTAGVVSELEQSRDTAARTDQLAAVGQLAAGIAHELRNPLTAVMLLVDSAVEENRTLSEDDLAVVREELSRIDAMLRSFLDFARPPKLIKRPIDLCDALEQAVDLVRPRAARQNISIQSSGGGRLATIADPQQLRQVFVNVLLNAIDAQPGGGDIRIVVDQEQGDDGPECVVRISDAGPGIAPDVQSSLFEPFVSTKDTGVGLGLAICRRLLRSHGGQIEANNLGTTGAQFSIRMPLESPQTVPSA
jgi:signal transduction histidine kinase